MKVTLTREWQVTADGDSDSDGDCDDKGDIGSDGDGDIGCGSDGDGDDRCESDGVLDTCAATGHLHGGDVADGELGAGGDLLLGLEHGWMDVRPSVIGRATYTLL